MRQRIDLDKCWRIAASEAELGSETYGDMILPHLPSGCPLSIDDVLEASLDVDTLLLRIEESARAPRPEQS